jgi:hypothetical protein
MNFQQNPSPSPLNTFNQSIQSGIQAVGEGYDQAKDNLTNKFDEFSTEAAVGVGATTGFLYSNTIIAKFAFIILVLIVFLFLMNLGISMISYFTRPSQSPYIIDGMIDGTNDMIVPQDPKNTESKPIYKSNNESEGLEFTWSSWIYIDDLNKSDSKYQHIFSKGNGGFDPVTNIASVNNAPGMYVSPMTNKLHIIMDSVKAPDSTTGNPNTIDIDNVPLKKWVHVAIRAMNTKVDVYVNGIIASRLEMLDTPKQNYGDIYIAQNGGFMGKLSALRYYNRALNIFEINHIVSSGPNLSVINDMGAQKGFKYLSNYWYSSKY